ncbi:MAG: hypothetical protein NZL95_08470 [Chitinophagales bacterium]|nr:hypothetical protein [Chitinophagales bacterium]MDW8428571.1 hypothetical protein [Chitinophagales bacterium]
MDASAVPLKVKRLLIAGFLLTLPTLVFWTGVAYSVLTRKHSWVDAMLAGSKLNHILLVAILPLISFVIAVACRQILKQVAIQRNLWHRETAEMKASQSLINWNVVLFSVMIISLINN